MQTRSTRSWLKRDWMFSKWNPIFVISLRSRESCWSHIQISVSRFPCNIVRTSAICVWKSIWKVSPVCDKSVQARDALGRYAGVGWGGGRVEGIIRLHLITILPLGLQKAELRDETMWRRESLARLSKKEKEI